jgi:putative tryptophan/tyrosine transport system substrate-binding protein
MIRRREFITLLGGAAAAWPIAAWARQGTGKIPRVGFLLNVHSELVDTLFRGLRDAGYVEGQNIVLETRFAGNMLDRIDQFATELVTLHCDLIFAAGPYAIQALTKATSTIPLVAIDLESDPVANRWAASIARPGGNLTGFFLDLPELGGKQIELLNEVRPNLSRVAFLWDSTVGLVQFSATEVVGRTAGVETLSLPIRRREEFKAAFDRAASQHAHAMVVLSSPLIFGQRSHIAELAVNTRPMRNDFKEGLDALKFIRDEADRYLWRELHGQWLPSLKDGSMSFREFSKAATFAIRQVQPRLGHEYPNRTDA